MWGGRGAIARPREAEWSSGLAAVFGVYKQQKYFKDPNDDDLSVFLVCNKEKYDRQ